MMVMVHVPPRLRLSHGRRSHHQQVLQVLPTGQLPGVLGPPSFSSVLSCYHNVPVLVLVRLAVAIAASERRRRRAVAAGRHVLLTAVILGQIVHLVHLKRKKSCVRLASGVCFQTVPRGSLPSTLLLNRVFEPYIIIVPCVLWSMYYFRL